MIYTITLNPAIDYYVTVDEFKIGGLNHSTSAYTLPGGKGINVSRVLKNYNTESIAMGFIGGSTGAQISQALDDSGLKTDFTKIEEPTRINIKLKTNKDESEISGVSPKIKKTDVDRLFDKLDKINDGDILVLSGSVPDTLDEDIYAKMIKKVSNKNVKIILDTRGLPLEHGLKEKVYLIKPNNVELEEILKIKINDIDDIIKGGKILMDLGAENVIVSMGGKGSVLITKNAVYIGNSPKGTLVSSVGSGDSMIAGIVYGICSKMSIEDAYKYGIASGSATAFKSGLAEMEDTRKLLPSISITKSR